MKTLYFNTNHFVRREGNVIDFTEYRNRLQQAKAVPAAVGNEVSYQWETDDSVWHSPETAPKAVRAHKAPQPAPLGKLLRRSVAEKLRSLLHTFRHYSLADKLEVAAAAATLGLVLTIWLQFLL